MKKAKELLIEIVTRFGVPSRIIKDNGKQFTGAAFTDYCEDLDTQLCYASMEHPKSNGQDERANGMLLQGLKSRIYSKLKNFIGRWLQELPGAVWGLRTSVHKSTRQTPFFLTYGAEAVLL